MDVVAYFCKREEQNGKHIKINSIDYSCCVFAMYIDMLQYIWHTVVMEISGESYSWIEWTEQE